MWLIIVALAILLVIIYPKASIFFLVPFAIAVGIFTYKYKKEYREKYSEGYDFFASYFTALFTLIEEEMPFGGVISLKANVKDTMSKEFLKSSEDAKFETRGLFPAARNFMKKK